MGTQHPPGTAEHVRVGPGPPTPSRPAHPWFALGMVVLGLMLATNSLMGPLFADVIDYPFTQTVLNETLGLEVVTLVLVAPLTVLAGALVMRSHRAGPLLALAPTSYGVYMLVQYVIGPQYPTYQLSIAWHLALFVLALALFTRAWTLAAPDHDVRPGRWAGVLAVLAIFVLSRWTPAIAGILHGGAVPAAARDLTMYWSIFLLDLGVVVPAMIATAVGLLRRATWARRALFAVMGWFAMVPPSVAAMSVVKVARGDPNELVADTVIFLVVTVAVAVLAVVLFRPAVAGASR